MLSTKLCESGKIMKDTENRACNTHGKFKECIQNFSWKNQKDIHEEGKTKTILAKVYFIHHGELR
jgi:hypothetical protein